MLIQNGSTYTSWRLLCSFSEGHAAFFINCSLRGLYNLRSTCGTQLQQLYGPDLYFRIPSASKQFLSMPASILMCSGQKQKVCFFLFFFYLQNMHSKPAFHIVCIGFFSFCLFAWLLLKLDCGTYILFGRYPSLIFLWN